MSFENWERFVKETLERLQNEKSQEDKGGGKAAGSETGGAKHDRTGKSSAQSIQKRMEQEKRR